MSRENLELALQVQPASDVDLAQLFRDDAVWAAWAEAVSPVFERDCKVVARELPGAETTYVGLDGLRAGWLDWYAPWETYHGEIEESIDLGERVLLLTLEDGRLPGSTQEVKLASANVWSVYEGRSPASSSIPTALLPSVPWCSSSQLA